MTDTTYTTDGVTGKLEFIQYHLSGLTAGDYIISVKQNVQIGNKAVASSPFSLERTFSVAGERFNIQPAEIQAVFPPANSLGEHSSVLPHIVFNRSTVPWERRGDNQNAHVPWLALLLFEEA